MEHYKNQRWLAIAFWDDKWDPILRLLLDYEAAQRRHELLKKQLVTLEQQQRVARVSYRNGRGSTSQMLSMDDKRDRLIEKLTEVEIRKDETVRELGQLMGYSGK